MLATVIMLIFIIFTIRLSPLITKGWRIWISVVTDDLAFTSLFPLSPHEGMTGSPPLLRVGSPSPTPEGRPWVFPSLRACASHCLKWGAYEHHYFSFTPKGRAGPPRHCACSPSTFRSCAVREHEGRPASPFPPYILLPSFSVGYGMMRVQRSEPAPFRVRQRAWIPQIRHHSMPTC
jgi:hypothetical protein